MNVAYHCRELALVMGTRLEKSEWEVCVSEILDTSGQP